MTPTKLQELLALREKATQAPWFAGPLQPKKLNGAPGGVSIGPTDLAERYGWRPDYTPEAFSHHYEDQIAQVQGGDHDPVANAAFIVSAHRDLPSIAEEMAAKDARIAELEKVAQAAKHVDDMRVFGFGEYQHLNPHEDEAQALEAVRVALSALSHGGGDE